MFEKSKEMKRAEELAWANRDGLPDWWVRLATKDALRDALRNAHYEGFRAAWWHLTESPATASILDQIQAGLEVAGVGEVIIDEAKARVFLAEHRGKKAVMG